MKDRLKKIMVAWEVLIIAGFVISCNNSQGSGKGTDDIALRTSATDTIIKRPTQHDLSKQQLEQQISKEIEEALSVFADSMVVEAVEAVAETRRAIGHLVEKNNPAAIKAIQTAIGKVEVVTTANPQLSFVPLEINIGIYDLIASIDVIREIKDEVEDLTDKGYLQAARKLLADVCSEMRITKQSLPLATYPVALKQAVQLARDKKPIEAAVVLNSALNTIVVEVRAVPMPLIRAERMLAEVDAALESGSVTENERIDILLDHADYEIRFAEALGYGKKDREFKELYSAIKDLKSEVRKEERSAKAREMLGNLRKKLESFKRRISPKSNETTNALAKK